MPRVPTQQLPAGTPVVVNSITGGLLPIGHVPG